MARVKKLDEKFLIERGKRIRQFHNNLNFQLRDYRIHGFTDQNVSSAMRVRNISAVQQEKMIKLFIEKHGADAKFFEIERNLHNGEVIASEDFRTQEQIIVELNKKINLQETLVLELIETKNTINQRLLQVAQETQRFLSANPSVLFDNTPIGEYVKKVKVILNLI